jgi:hypothetical protein
VVGLHLWCCDITFVVVVALHLWWITFVVDHICGWDHICGAVTLHLWWWDYICGGV